MNTIFSRILGIFIIAAAIFGLILSALGIGLIWRQKAALTERLGEDISLLQDNLEATREGLEIIEDVLDTTVDTLDTLEDALDALSKSVTEMSPLITSIETLSGEDLPNTIATTRSSLEVAGTSAEIIDNALTLITSIPLIPVEPYAPAVPLNVALQEVSDSLITLPESLVAMESNLQDSRQNLILINAQIQDLIVNVDQIQGTIETAGPVVATYEDAVDRLLERTVQIEGNLPGWLNRIAWALTAFLVWLGFTQIGLFIQGVEMLRPAPQSTTPDE